MLDDKGIVETKVFVKNYLALTKGYRLIANKGGTWSGKTFGFLAALAVYLYNSPDRRKALIIGQTGNELRDGAYSDWETIMEILQCGRLTNKSSRIWKVGKSTIIFKSLDKEGKAKSGKNDIVFINECNHISWKIVKHLLMRCKIFACDWNPSNKFWFQSEVLPAIDTYMPYLYTHTTYLDNPKVPEAALKFIMGLSGSDRDIYALGIEGRRESLIYDYSLYADGDILNARMSNSAGFLDFGFTNDVTAFGEAFINGDYIYAKEHFYKSGLLAKDIDSYLTKISWPKSKVIICDNIPYPVAELRAYGWYLLETKKFAGSVRFGIDVLRQYSLKIHINSKNIINELDNYEWAEKDNERLNQPVDKYNHLLDGLRYYAMKYASSQVLNNAKMRVGSDNLV